MTDSAPTWVVAAHHPNQISDIFWHLGPTRLAEVYFPRPEQAEPAAALQPERFDFPARESE